MPLRAQVLLADVPQIVSHFSNALAHVVQLTPAATYAEAVSNLEGSRVDGVIVGYHFDNNRPERLVNHIRKESEKPYLPILLIRALPLKDGEQAEMPYLADVDSFVDLHKLTLQHGMEQTGSVLRDCILRLLRRNF